MKKIICKKEYDTETATLVKKFTSGALGDPSWLWFSIRKCGIRDNV